MNTYYIYAIIQQILHPTLRARLNFALPNNMIMHGKLGPKRKAARVLTLSAEFDFYKTALYFFKEQDEVNKFSIWEKLKYFFLR